MWFRSSLSSAVAAPAATTTTPSVTTTSETDPERGPQRSPERHAHHHASRNRAASSSVPMRDTTRCRHRVTTYCPSVREDVDVDQHVNLEQYLRIRGQDRPAPVERDEDGGVAPASQRPAIPYARGHRRDVTRSSPDWGLSRCRRLVESGSWGPAVVDRPEGDVEGRRDLPPVKARDRARTPGSAKDSWGPFGASGRKPIPRGPVLVLLRDLRWASALPACNRRVPGSSPGTGSTAAGRPRWHLGVDLAPRGVVRAVFVVRY
jgi:hypothetical protein